MSCPIPLRIINPHYKKRARDENIPVSDFDHLPDYYLDVPCGQCINCLQSKGNQWSLRLSLEWKYMTQEARKNSFFVTLTLSDDYINEDHSILIRRFLERIRKHYKRSCRHWIISEYGDQTKRLHFHGILFDIPFPRHQLLALWKYGHVTIKPLTSRRIGYVTTYVNKNIKKTAKLIEDPRYRQQIWTSPGLGKQVIEDKTFQTHLAGRPLPVMYNTSNHLVAIPRYFRQKVFTVPELEQLKTAYFNERSEDVIPDPPYFIGKRKYTDYTLFLIDAYKLNEHRKYINRKYKPKVWQTNLTTLCHDSWT